MTDPATIVSLVGTALQLIEAVKVIVDYGMTLRDAPSDVIALAHELDVLHSVFQNLASRLEQQDSVHTFPRSSTLYSTASDFIDQLEEFRKELERFQVASSGPRRALRLLTWPLKQSQTQRRLHLLQRYTSIFHLSVTLEGFELLQRDLSSFAETQRNTNQLLRALQNGLQARLTASPQQRDSGLSDVVESLRRALDTYGFDGQYEREILRKLSTLDYRARQQEYFLKRHEGTYASFLNDARFTEWLRASKGSMLWCPGNPGAGKTVLASAVIDHVLGRKLDLDAAVVYIYCDYRETEAHDVSALLSTMTRQLLEQDGCQAPIEEMEKLQEEVEQRHRALTEDDLMVQFRKCAQDFGRVYIIIDALDELPDHVRNDFIQRLAALDGQVYLFVTSRHNIDPTIDFDNAARFDVVASWEDVETYMRSEIKKSSRLKRYIEGPKGDPSLETEILKGVYGMTEGIFLLATLQIQSLSKQHSVDGVRNALRNPPKIVLDQYNETMDRVNDQTEEDTKLALRLISLVRYAMRPLTVDEVCHALAIQPGERSLGEVPDIDTALEVAVGLVRVVGHSTNTASSDPTTTRKQTVRLVHHTLQEYIDQRQLFPTFHVDLTQKCLTYLSYDDLEDWLTAEVSEDGWAGRLSFLEYAALNWGIHAQAVQTETVNHILTFLTQAPRPHVTKVLHKAYSRADNLLRYKRYDIPPMAAHSRPRTPLIIATILQLDYVAEVLLPSPSINSKDMNGLTALHYAARSGNVAIIDKLVAAGADLDDKDPSPLSIALWHLQLPAAELLIKNGAEVDHDDLSSLLPSMASATRRESPEKRESAIMFLRSHGPHFEARFLELESLNQSSVV
ncbi:uncharacterized protein KY384_008049 [Bacidia gigantensis]|uniref:uncharacterized protein n=1 Tax=Bacidia gigantensis TaxID=2732470 RepID=UPI001D042D27|nr:uncharacterized protein KY384_008049 [Bacidia gigantensis]KAG8527305.1 hypothetical protein KY384_008049 [Bacidia gigantensis]